MTVPEQQGFEERAHRALMQEFDINKPRRGSALSGLAHRLAQGSFYTPLDVACYVWRIIALNICPVSVKAGLRRIASDYDILDPCCGTGVFQLGYFTLLGQYGLMGEPKRRRQRYISVDVNKRALDFARRNAGCILNRVDCEFRRGDGLDSIEGLETHKPLLIVGNPPYTNALPQGMCADAKRRYRNLFAEFVDRSIDRVVLHGGAFGMIVPMSIAYSRYYAGLRRRLFGNRLLCRIASFDNIPDPLFTNGKPDSANTNTINSQRTSIVSFRRGSRARLYSSKMFAHKRQDRRAVLGSDPELQAVSPYGDSRIILKPYDRDILSLMNSRQRRIKDYVVGNGEGGGSVLYYGSTARHYLSVGLSEFRSSGVCELRFADRETRDCVFALLGSEVGLRIWKTLGDGFHVTQDNLMQTPLPKELLRRGKETSKLVESLWRRRRRYQKSKTNASIPNISYDFTGSREINSLLSECRLL